MGVFESQPLLQQESHQLLQQQLYKAIEARSFSDLKALLDNPECDFNAPIGPPQIDKANNGVAKILPLQFAMKIHERALTRSPAIALEIIGPLEESGGELVNMLMSSGRINVNATDIDGRTALHIAAIYQCAEAARLLIADPQCDLNAVDTIGGYSPIHLAASTSRCNPSPLPLPSVFDQLLAHSRGRCNVNAISGKTKESILHFACVAELREEHFAAIMANEHFTLLNAQNFQNRTALSLLIRRYPSDSLAAKMINSNRFDLDEVDDNKETLLHLAVIVDLVSCYQPKEFRRADTVAALLASPQSPLLINSRNAKGVPPLHLAVGNNFWNHTATVSALLSHPDVDANIVAGNDYLNTFFMKIKKPFASWSGTVVHIAVFQGLVSVLEVLIRSYKCDLCALDSRGNTAYHLINLEAKPTHNTPMQSLCVLRLLEQNAPRGFGTRNGSNQTPLLSILSRPSTVPVTAELLKAFIDLGEDVNAMDCDGKSAIHYLLRSGVYTDVMLLKLCRLLLDAGACPSHGDLLLSDASFLWSLFLEEGITDNRLSYE